MEISDNNEAKPKLEAKPALEEDITASRIEVSIDNTLDFIVKAYVQKNREMKEKLLQESQSEIQNNVCKEMEHKQEVKNHMNKCLVENMQVIDKKVESDVAVTVNQIATNSVSTIEANGIDNEDSINLTIGEDEENLLAEEVTDLIIL